PARGLLSRATASSGLAALANAMTSWSATPAVNRRATPPCPGSGVTSWRPERPANPRASAATQTRAGGGGDARQQEQPVDRGEPDQQPHRPLWNQREHEPDDGYHRTVVADQL